MVAGVKMILLLALAMEHVENLQRRKLNPATTHRRLSTEDNVLAMSLYLLFFIQNMIVTEIPKQLPNTVILNHVSNNFMKPN